MGVFGVSMGASAAINAAGKEPKLRAMFLDSPFSDPERIILERLARRGLPMIVWTPALLVGKLAGIMRVKPIDEIKRANQPRIFLAHGTQDETVPQAHSKDLDQAARASGADVRTWFDTDTNHLVAMLDHADEYEKTLIAFFTDTLKTQD